VGVWVGEKGGARMTARTLPGTVRKLESQPVLPAPLGLAEKAELARQARALGKALRKGKRVLFASRRHLVG
jgi:hypothetical protein